MAIKPTINPKESGPIQEFIGTAYDVVKTVHDNLDLIRSVDPQGLQQLETNLNTIEQNVLTAKTEIENIYTNIQNDTATIITSTEEAQAIIADFNRTYLGTLALDPTLNNEGNPIVEGNFYFNSTSNQLRFYDGSVWVEPATIAIQKANEAAASATTATNSKNLAQTAETNATTAASTATTKATEASTSAASAETFKNNAANSATAANTSATNAATSEMNASTSAANALASESKSEAWAETAEDIEVEVGKYSALHHAIKAALSATSASSSATTATTQAGLATTAKDDAVIAKNAAQAAETTATTKANEASASATAASTSETNAATSETNASTSATNAQSSETAASGHATDALAYRNKAGDWAEKTVDIEVEPGKYSALHHATKAEVSASQASTSATNANTAESGAVTAKNDAQAAKTGAETAETNAGTQATNASASATAAATSESNAATSESNAATSATQASNSASAAQTAETNAGNYAATAQTARDQALAAFDSFDDKYLGEKASDPTTDNDGFALVSGALYFNSTTENMRVYDGINWKGAYASLDGALLSNNNLSDLGDINVAKQNLVLDQVDNVPATSLRDRSTHTGSQAISTITNLQTSLDGKAASSHNHIIANVTGLQTALDDKSQLGHIHAISEITGLQTALDGKVGTTGYNKTNWDNAYSWGNHALAGYLTSFTETDPTVPAHVKNITTTEKANWNDAVLWGDHSLAGYLTSVGWNDINGKPTTFTPSTHNHSISEVTGLQTTLDGKAASSHSHSISNVTGLQTALDGKSAVGHTHSWSDITTGVPATATRWPSWTEVTSKPSTFTPSSHTHNYENPLTFQASGSASVSRTGDTITISATDTNTDTNNYANSLGFSTTTGILTVGRSGLADLTVDLDGRYLISLPSHNHSGADITSGTVSETYLPDVYSSAKTFNSWANFKGGRDDVAPNGAYQRSVSLNEGTTLSRLHHYGRNTSSSDSNYRAAFYTGSSYIDMDAVNNGLTISSRYVAEGGSSTSWGSTSGLATGAFSADIPNNTSATWIWSGCAGSTFRCGFQMYNSGGIARLYVSSNYYIFSGGDFTAQGDVTAFSDERLKENIVTIDSALDKVKQLRGVYFNKKDDGAKVRKVGLIAQETEKVVPELVGETDDGTKHIAYGNTVGLLVEALKEEAAKREFLEERIEKLERLLEAK